MPSGQSDVNKTVTTPAQRSGLSRRGKKKNIRKKKPVSEFTKRVVDELATNPDMTLKEAGIRAGAPPKQAAVRAHRALKSESAQELFRRAMLKRPGLQDAALAKKLEEGLDATVTKLFAHEGQIIDERDMVDWGARQSYLALVARLRGLEPSTKAELTGANGQPLVPSAPPQIVALSALSTEQLLKLLDIIEPADPRPAAGAENPGGTSAEGVENEGGGAQ